MFPAWRVLCYSMFISGGKKKLEDNSWCLNGFKITVPSNICRLPIYVDKQAYQIRNASTRIMSAVLPPRLFCVLYEAAHKANTHPNPEWYCAVVSGIYKINPTHVQSYYHYKPAKLCCTSHFYCPECIKQCPKIYALVRFRSLNLWLEHMYLKHSLAQMHHLQHSTKVVVFCR